MTLTDVEILSLLHRLDKASKNDNGYPPFGLDLHGPYSRSQQLIEVVREWLRQASAEAQR